MDIDVTLVEDSRRLAKQCKMKDLIEELENKCKKVYQFGETFIFTMHTSTMTGTKVAHLKLETFKL